MSDLFKSTSKFTEAITQINELSANVFYKLIGRILPKLPVQNKNENIFSEEEEGKLQNMLSLSPTKLNMFIDSIIYIFETASYNRLNDENLFLHLKAVNLNEDHAKAMKICWSENGEKYLERLKGLTLGAPKILNDVAWQLQLQLAQDNATKLTTPVAVFEFKTSNPKGYGSVEEDTFVTEFTHDELFDFFTKIERIQEQVDRLG